MTELTVIDNFLDSSEFEELSGIMSSDGFPWFFNNYISYHQEAQTTEVFQFVHAFYNSDLPLSNYFNILEKLLIRINPFCILRIKANLLTRTEEIIEYGLHSDTQDPNLMTAVLYLNTNNGYTVFESGEKVNSIENRIAFFPSNLVHAGSSCTDQKRRMVINIVYYPTNVNQVRILNDNWLNKGKASS